MSEMRTIILHQSLLHGARMTVESAIKRISEEYGDLDDGLIHRYELEALVACARALEKIKNHPPSGDCQVDDTGSLKYIAHNALAKLEALG